MKIWWIWKIVKIEIWSEELVDGDQTVPYHWTWGSHLEVVNCLVVVFPIYFNPNNSLLIILQISLLFMCTPSPP